MYPIISDVVCKDLPLELLGRAQELDGETWLHTQDLDGNYGVGCSICAQLLAECDKDIIAKYGITSTSGLKPFRLKAHACSANHLAAVRRLLEPTDWVGVPLSQETEAPPESGFKALMAHIRKGGSLRDGLPGVGHFRKIKSMTFVLAEAFRRLYRQHLGQCCSINLLRDERHSRLLVRFRCANLQAERSIGVIGQAKVVKSTATNLTEATKSLFLDFCTKNHGVPYHPNPSEVMALDNDLLEHMCACVHALTVDAAGNEVASGENMRSSKSVTADNAKAFTPNLQVIIRDKAHASRRILERPWNSDDYLTLVARAFVTDPQSVAQQVQHSSDFQEWYKECCEKSANKVVASNFGHLRAAKHRFESLCSPLSRICLDWEACLAFLVRVATERSGQASGQFAVSTLASIDEEMMIQAALLADACEESMVLIRFFDEAEVDNAKICTKVAEYLGRIGNLFDEQFVWSVEGYTKVTLDFLKRTTTFMSGGGLRSIGGPRAVTPALMTSTIQRMQAWVLLAKHVVAAEHPDFELVSSFACFNLKEFPAQSAEDLKAHGRSSKFDLHLQRLANCFKVDWTCLKNQFFDIGSIARTHQQESDCDNLEAWQQSLKKTSSAAARSRHPVDCLEQVLAEYACMSASDSIIERDFSRVKALLGDRIHTMEAENHIVTIAAAVDPAVDSLVLSMSPKIWRELYPSSRTREKKRFDKGVTRFAGGRLESPEKTLPSETMWKKRRRMEVDSATGDAPDKVPAAVEQAWTEEHEKEKDFNHKKRNIRLFEALASGAVLPEELTIEQVAAAYNHFQAVETNMLQREAGEARLQRAVARNCPSEDDLQGLICFFLDDSLRSPAMDRATDRRGWTISPDFTESKVLVMSDPSSMNDSGLITLSIYAGLKGAWICTPDMVLNNRGCCLKIKEALRTKRKIYCTDLFKAHQQAVMNLISGFASRNFQLLQTLEDFAVQKNLAERRHCSAEVICLLEESERSIFSEIKHCFSIEEFRDFIYRLDLEASCPGL